MRVWNTLNKKIWQNMNFIAFLSIQLRLLGIFNVKWDIISNLICYVIKAFLWSAHFSLPLQDNTM